MQVQKTSNNSPSFNGYVHKSLKNYIKEVVDTECTNLVINANKEKTEADKNALLKIYETGKRVLSKFDTFMKPQHKDSAIELNEASYLQLTNPVASSPVNILQKPDVGIGWHIVEGVQEIMVGNHRLIYKNMPKLSHLDTLEKIADDLLNNIQPEDVNKSFLERAEDALKYNALYKNGTGIIGRLKTLFQASTVDHFAQEIGVVTTAKEDANAYVDYIKKTKKQAKMQQKKLENKNAQILNSVLNDKN